MFKCMDCGCEFEEPKVNREYHGLEYGHEDRCYCPNCGSEDYDEAKNCEICDEIVYGERFCDCCKNEAVSMIKIDYMSIKSNHMSASNEAITDLLSEALDIVYVEERSKR